jgi:hypothetical protein
MSDRAAWAAQDILKSTKSVVGKITKLAKKASQTVQIRAEAVNGALGDGNTPPHTWPKKFEGYVELVLEAPEKTPIEAQTNNYRELIQATLDYMRKEMPGQELMVRAAAKAIVMPSKLEGRYLDGDTETIEVPVMYVTQPPHKLSYHLLRSAVVLWRKRTGEPWTGERGWEPAIFDTYDVCVVAGLEDCGPGKQNRRQFLDVKLGARPWDGN